MVAWMRESVRAGAIRGRVARAGDAVGDVVGDVLGDVVGDVVRRTARRAWQRSLVLRAALFPALQAAPAHGAAEGVADASRVRLAQRLVDSAAESIAAFAAGGLRIGDPDDGVVLSPTLVVDPALDEALDRATALELLLVELPRPNRAVWRVMSAPPAAPPTGGDAPRASAAAGFHPSAESELERLSRLLVIEALLSRLGDGTRLPADAVRA